MLGFASKRLIAPFSWQPLPHEHIEHNENCENFEDLEHRVSAITI